MSQKAQLEEKYGTADLVGTFLNSLDDKQRELLHHFINYDMYCDRVWDRELYWPDIVDKTYEERRTSPHEYEPRFYWNELKRQAANNKQEQK